MCGLLPGAAAAAAAVGAACVANYSTLLLLPRVLRQRLPATAAGAACVASHQTLLLVLLLPWVLRQRLPAAEARDARVSISRAATSTTAPCCSRYCSACSRQRRRHGCSMSASHMPRKTMASMLWLEWGEVMMMTLVGGRGGGDG
jgi:hypothetical protein